MQKGSALAVLLIFVLLIFLGGIYYFNKLQKLPEPVSPAVNKSQDVSIYSDQNLGFKFEYGQGLKVLEDSEEQFNKRGNGNFRKNFAYYVGYEPGKFVGAVVVLNETDSFETNPFTVWVFDNPIDLTIDNWHHNYWYYPFVWGDFTYTGKYILAPKDEATVSGQTGKSGIIDYREGKPKFVYISKEQKMYLFRIIGQQGEEILAGFKFL